MLSKEQQLKFINQARTDKKRLEIKCLDFWQEIVKARAGYKCEFNFCRNKEPYEIMQAHHFFSKGAYRNLKFDIENGICLCAWHHVFGNEAAHLDPLWKDKILGLKTGYIPIRTENWIIIMERRSLQKVKLDLNMELLYLIQEAKKYKELLRPEFREKYAKDL